MQGVLEIWHFEVSAYSCCVLRSGAKWRRISGVQHFSVTAAVDLQDLREGFVFLSDTAFVRAQECLLACLLARTRLKIYLWCTFFPTFKCAFLAAAGIPWYDWALRAAVWVGTFIINRMYFCRGVGTQSMKMERVHTVTQWAIQLSHCNVYCINGHKNVFPPVLTLCFYKNENHRSKCLLLACLSPSRLTCPSDSFSRSVQCLRRSGQDGRICSCWHSGRMS